MHNGFGASRGLSLAAYVGLASLVTAFPTHGAQASGTTPDTPDATSPQAEPAKGGDGLALYNRWKGADKAAQTYIVTVTERSEANGTATIVFDEDGKGQKISMNLEIKDGQIKVVKATRANSAGVKKTDQTPEYKIVIAKDGELTVSGLGHFDAPRAGVKKMAFPLDMTCQPIEPAKRPAAKAKPDQAKSTDVFALNHRWKGADKAAQTYIVTVTARSEANGTATIVFDEDGRGQKIWMDLEINGGKVKVVKAIRANGNGVKNTDPEPQYRIAIGKDGALTVSGQGHFNAPGAGVKKKPFALDMTCQPDEPAKGKGGKKGKDGNN